MNFIENVSLAAIAKGIHKDAGPKAILIQIGDPGSVFPIPRGSFGHVHQFEFLDIDESASKIPEWEFRMTEKQAKDIITILKSALKLQYNVIVHCHAGICRSGAIAEIGEMLGFEATGNFRISNVWVKKLLMRELGWMYE